MDMIERVARAICRSTVLGADLDGGLIFDNPDYVIPAKSRGDGIPIIRWKLYVEQARAAIEAMREPTKEVELAGDNAMSSAAFAISIWDTMIDAALREKVDA